MNAHPAGAARSRRIAFTVAAEMDLRRDRDFHRILASLGFAAILLACAPARAAVAPPMGIAQSFAVLGASAVTNGGPSVITGDLGISPNTASSVTGSLQD